MTEQEQRLELDAILAQLHGADRDAVLAYLLQVARRALAEASARRR